jgi:hypothetical protein
VLTAFVIFQLALDVVVAFALLARLLQRRAAPTKRRGGPPQWYQEFLLLTEDILALVEPVLEALESGRLLKSAPAAPEPAATAPGEGPAPLSAAERRREAFAQLRAGASPEEVERRGQLQPAELRLIRNLVAAEAKLAESQNT